MKYDYKIYVIPLFREECETRATVEYNVPGLSLHVDSGHNVDVEPNHRLYFPSTPIKPITRVTVEYRKMSLRVFSVRVGCRFAMVGGEEIVPDISIECCIDYMV